MATDPITHYILVRPDLPRGPLSAQVTHAAGESSPGNLPGGTYAVVLAADTPQLLQFEERLKAVGLPHKAIRESSGECAGQITAIGVCPDRRSKLKKYFSSLPLLR